MAEKSAKKETKKTAKASSGSSVLGNLPSSRPTRIGAERRTATAAKPSAAKSTKAKPAKPTPKKRAPTAKATRAKPAAATPPPPPVSEPQRDGRPSATEVVTTAVQAAGELGKIGVTVGRQVLKRATNRIPRP
jgi:hypothetical protein